jgi:hypothetical protein
VGEHRRLAALGVVLVIVVALYPWVGGGLIAHLAASRASARLGLPVTIAHGRAGLLQVTLEGVTVAGADGDRPLLSVDRAVVPFGVALGGRGPIRVSGVRVHVVRGGPTDNVSALIARLRGKGPKEEAKDEGAPSKAGGRVLPSVAIEGGVVDVRDE